MPFFEKPRVDVVGRARAVGDAAVVRGGHELGDRAVEGLARDNERPVDHRTNDFLGGLFDSSGVTGDRLFDRSPSSEKPLGTPGGRGGVRNCPGLCETRGGVGTGGGGGMAEASGIRELNASSSANLAAWFSGVKSAHGATVSSSSNSVGIFVVMKGDT